MAVKLITAGEARCLADSMDGYLAHVGKLIEDKARMGESQLPLYVDGLNGDKKVQLCKALCGGGYAVRFTGDGFMGIDDGFCVDEDADILVRGDFDESKYDFELLSGIIIFW